MEEQERVFGRVSGAVRELAVSRGVSERTVWRWVRRMREQGSPLELDRVCAYSGCGRPLPGGVTVRRRYCGDRCRVYAHRERGR